MNSKKFREKKKKKKKGEEEEEEEEEKDLFLLSVDDFERRGIKIHDEKTQNLTGFEALLLVAEVASQKLLEEEEFKRKKMEERLMTEKPLKKHVTEHVYDPKRYLKKGSILDLNQNPQELDVVECEKQIRKPKRSSSTAEQTPKMLENMRNLIESVYGDNIKLVIQIYLFHTDNGMSIPMKQIRSEFLTQKEKELLDQGDQMKLVFVEPSLAVSQVVLKKWRIMNKAGDDEKKKKYSYGLTTDWNKVRMANDLKEGDEVQLWSFRIEEQLCLALVRVSDQAENHI